MLYVISVSQELTNGALSLLKQRRTSWPLISPSQGSLCSNPHPFSPSSGVSFCLFLNDLIQVHSSGSQVDISASDLRTLYQSPSHIPPGLTRMGLAQTELTPSEMEQHPTGSLTPCFQPAFCLCKNQPKCKFNHK